MARHLWPELETIPHELGFLDAGGVRTRYLRLGDTGADARALLLLHGFGSQLETFVRNVGALSRDRLVIAIDLLGHGFTDAPPRPYEVADYVDHSRRAMAALAIERFGVVGVALGAWVATRMAAAHPEQVESLTVVAPTGLTADPEAMAHVRQLSLDAVADPDLETTRARIAAVFVDPAQIPDDLVESRLEILRQPHAVAATRSALALQEMAFRPRNLLRADELSAIAAPALVVSGDRDTLSPPAVGDIVAAAIPAARRMIVPGGGHWLHFEHPDTFNAAQRALQEEVA
jgi:2-hydroxy-6-oxonona-2,4-dienedioate hydrolase